MKLLHFVCVLVFISSCQSDSNDAVIVKDLNEEAMSEHTVMFYNVENLFDTFDDPYTRDEEYLPNSDKEWTNERFSHKLNQLTDVILGVDSSPASFIGLVEIENKYVLDQLVDNAYLRRFNYNVVHHESPDVRGMDVGFIYNEDKFKVIDHEPIRIPLNHGKKTRDILYVKGRFVGHEEEIHVFINHWSSRREGKKETEPKRIIAAETLRYHIDEIIDDNDYSNVIVMGDFNDYPDNTSLYDYLKAKEYTDLNNDELFNLSYKRHSRGEGSYNYKGDWVMMDQIIVSKNLLDKKNQGYYVEKDAFEVFDEKWIMYRDKKYNEMKPNKTYGGDNYFGGFSDHLPVFVTLKKSYE